MRVCMPAWLFRRQQHVEMRGSVSHEPCSLRGRHESGLRHQLCEQLLWRRQHADMCAIVHRPTVLCLPTHQAMHTRLPVPVLRPAVYEDMRAELRTGDVQEHDDPLVHGLPFGLSDMLRRIAVPNLHRSSAVQLLSLQWNVP